MAKARKGVKPLSSGDFSADGEPYSEVIVTISIRILGKGITRSRLAVNVYPDAALESLACQSLEVMKKDKYGLNEEGVFGACLSDNFNGYEDLEQEYPRIDEGAKDRSKRECAQAMNAYIKESVDWARALHKQGMVEAARNDRPPSAAPLVI